MNPQPYRRNSRFWARFPPFPHTNDATQTQIVSGGRCPAVTHPPPLSRTRTKSGARTCHGTESPQAAGRDPNLLLNPPELFITFSPLIALYFLAFSTDIPGHSYRSSQRPLFPPQPKFPKMTAITLGTLPFLPSLPPTPTPRVFTSAHQQKEISWQLSSAEGREGGEQWKGDALSLFRRKKGKERCHRSVCDVSNAKHSHGEGRQ